LSVDDGFHDARESGVRLEVLHISYLPRGQIVDYADLLSPVEKLFGKVGSNEACSARQKILHG
jgi:hypothetical protein